MIADLHQLKYRNIIIIIILGILFLFIAVPRIVFPDLDHGDEFQDADVLDSGKNFLRFGFIKCRFLPFFELNSEAPAQVYTHYPPLPQIINGMLSTIFNVQSLNFFRSIALLFSLLNLIFWYLFVKKITGSYNIGFLSAIFYLTSPFFIYGIDSLGEICYSDFLRSLILFVFAYTAYNYKRNKGHILLLWVLIAIESFTTFEYIIFLSLFFVLFKYLFKAESRFPSWKVIMVLFSAPVAGFLLHFLQNAWYFGGIRPAVADLMNAAIQRVANSADAPAMSFYAWWHHVIVRSFSSVFLFNYLFLFMASFFSYLLCQRLSVESRKELSLLLRLFIILGICGVSWYVAFPSHSWAHAFVGFLVRHLVPAASAGFAIICYVVMRYIKENLDFRRYANICLIFIIFTIVITGIRNSDLPVTPAKIESAQQFIRFKECLLSLKQLSSPRDLIAVNYYRFPFIRYYTDRNCVFVFNKSSLEAQSRVPRYFIFMPYANQNTHDLYEYLLQNYAPVWQCDSSSFPAIFLKLKK